MSHVGCASVKAYVREWKNPVQRQMRKWEKNKPADTKASAEGGQELLQACSTSSPAARGEAPGGVGCPPAAHGSHMEQISMLQPMEEPPVEQLDVAWRRLRLMESPRRSRPRAGAAAHGEEPTQEQGALGGAAAHGGPVLEQSAPGG